METHLIPIAVKIVLVGHCRSSRQLSLNGWGGAIALNSDKKHLRDVKKYSRDMKKYSIRQMLHISLLGRGLESQNQYVTEPSLSV